LLEGSLIPGLDIVVIARKPAGGANFYEIKNSLMKLLKRQNAVIQEPMSIG